VLQARWNEIDRQARVWTVPASRVKSNREHRVALTDRHIEILDSAAAIDNGSGFIFPGRSEKSPLSGMVFLMSYCQKLWITG
jgi:integrase